MFLRLVRDGDIVFDVGANRGIYTLLFSHIVGRQGAVHAFEPVPTTFAVFNQLMRREQHFPNIIANNVGLSENPGRTSIHLPGGDDMQASLRYHKAGSWGSSQVEAIECELNTLDRYVEKRALRRLNFIKIDVEGAELLAVRGGQRTLATFLPVIHMEFCLAWTRNFSYDAGDVVDLLQSIGYRHFYRGEDLSLLVDPATALNTTPDSQNLICSPKRLN
jgi:FkbM family methyltransferase